MKRPVLFASVGCLALAALHARAALIAPQPIPFRVATADAVVVGKVTGFADKTVPAKRFEGDRASYQVATVKVEETLLGKRAKGVKVGFIPAAGGPGRVRPGGGVRPGGIRPISYAGPQLRVGQEACLFLHKVPGKDFYSVNFYFDVIDKKLGGEPNPKFAGEVKEARRCARLLADPRKGLKSKKEKDRLTTAAMLVKRYRTQKPPFNPNPRTEPIDREESKLILRALRKADWKDVIGPEAMMAPRNLFFMLGLTNMDGWNPPMDVKELPAEAKKWLEANEDKYRVRRIVGPGEKGGRKR
jgi:hypothetical protein